jgi:hypothetical protein
VRGFFWTSAGDCSFVLVTDGGLELYSVRGARQGLRFLGRSAHPVRWWRYWHEARIVLLGTGDMGNWLQVGTLNVLFWGGG